MFVRELRAHLESLPGIGPQIAARLARLGISSVASLLTYYPRDWEDRSRFIPLKDFQKESMVCTQIRVIAHDWIHPRSGTSPKGREQRILKIYIEDETAQAVLMCFNRPFLERQLVVGKTYWLWGQFQYRYGELQSSNFEFEMVYNNNRSPRFFGKILPIYSLTEGLSQNQLRTIMERALDRYGTYIETELPSFLVEKYNLLPTTQAIRAIHFPLNQEELERARQTLIYQELFYLELLIGRRAQNRKAPRDAQKSPHIREHPFVPYSDPTASPAGLIRAFLSSGDTLGHLAKHATDAASSAVCSPVYDAPPVSPATSLFPLQEAFLRRLPFSLTPGQREAINDINKDMVSPIPMARLIQGDVGCGKTLVSFFAALAARELGGQTALMAPTELLARQHAENAARLLEPLGLHVAFLTGNIKAQGRAHLLKALAAGDIDLVVGTHALFSQDVVYYNLRLVIIDEQHRFGVLQRSQILAKGKNPDLLMMSATPIPRTLALTVFGDLEVSTIRDMPGGRKPVKTHLAKQSSEQRVYEFVRRELEKGHQAYFVYPLIDEGTSEITATLKDAQSMAERLARDIYPDYTVAIIHSRLEEEKKRGIMDAFRKGEIRILVATSVVEVGVDVPNATCMVIEHAERFGLAALHQLRGRVGRGPDQSYCFLVYSDNLSDDGKQRLTTMLTYHDGFIIAEEDLKIRGPGHLAGKEQSGYFTLGLADPIRDVETLHTARQDAFSIIEHDPGFLLPEHTVLREVLSRSPPFEGIAL
ncbi:MAG: ATP-dependent DNA helicase RecG [Treponemataceae bacterium]|nr:ATP-dependent DNA helicase RecG [Treponemataceae bacterium]